MGTSNSKPNSQTSLEEEGSKKVALEKIKKEDISLKQQIEAQEKELQRREQELRQKNEEIEKIKFEQEKQLKVIIEQEQYAQENIQSYEEVLEEQNDKLRKAYEEIQVLVRLKQEKESQIEAKSAIRKKKNLEIDATLKQMKSYEKQQVEDLLAEYESQLKLLGKTEEQNNQLEQQKEILIKKLISQSQMRKQANLSIEDVQSYSPEEDSDLLIEEFRCLNSEVSEMCKTNAELYGQMLLNFKDFQKEEKVSDNQILKEKILKGVEQKNQLAKKNEQIHEMILQQTKIIKKLQQNYDLKFNMIIEMQGKLRQQLQEEKNQKEMLQKSKIKKKTNQDEQGKILQQIKEEKNKLEEKLISEQQINNKIEQSKIRKQKALEEKEAENKRLLEEKNKVENEKAELFKKLKELEEQQAKLQIKQKEIIEEEGSIKIKDEKIEEGKDNTLYKRLINLRDGCFLDKSISEVVSKIDDKISIESLVKKLEQGAKNDVEKIYRLYLWEQKNFCYDMSIYNGGKRQPQDPESVFRHRIPVCDGFSQFFQKAAELMGFMSHQIVGYSKGIGYQHGEAILKDDHAWNVVKIFGEWFLLDVTWSGCREVGGQEQDQQQLKKVDNFFFMTDPEQFIYTHFAITEKWNLQEEKKKWTKRKFEKMPDLKSHFFNLQLKLLSHEQQSVINVDDNVLVIRIEAEPDVRIFGKASLYRDSANTEVEYSSYSVRSEQDEGVYEVYFHLRQKTDYKVAIFAKRMTQDLFISQSIEKDQSYYQSAVFKAENKNSIQEGKEWGYPFTTQYENFALKNLTPCFYFNQTDQETFSWNFRQHRQKERKIIFLFKITEQGDSTEIENSGNVIYGQNHQILIQCSTRRAGKFIFQVYAKFEDQTQSTYTQIMNFLIEQVNNKVPEQYGFSKKSSLDTFQLELQNFHKYHFQTKNNKEIIKIKRGIRPVLYLIQLEFQNKEIKNQDSVQYSQDQSQSDQITLTFNQPGVHKLQIFAKFKDISNKESYNQIMSNSIEYIGSESQEKFGFPQTQSFQSFEIKILHQNQQNKFIKCDQPTLTFTFQEIGEKVSLTAFLFQDENQIADRSFQQYFSENKLHEIEIAFPQPGNYKIVIGANRFESKSYTFILNYEVETSFDRLKTKSFPTQFSLFQNQNCKILEQKYNLNSKDIGQIKRFAYEIPGLFSPQIQIENNYIPLKLTKNNIYEANIKVTSLEINLLAQQAPSSLNYNFLLKYGE